MLNTCAGAWPILRASRHQYSVDNNERLINIRPHRGAVRAVSFSADGTCKFARDISAVQRQNIFSTSLSLSLTRSTEHSLVPVDQICTRPRQIGPWPSSIWRLAALLTRYPRRTCMRGRCHSCLVCFCFPSFCHSRHSTFVWSRSPLNAMTRFQYVLVSGDEAGVIKVSNSPRLAACACVYQRC